MQYVDVALAIRTGRHSSIYTYTIPPELLPQIAPGVLVEVPLGKNYAHGVIVRLRAQLPSQHLRGRLRPLKRLLSPWPLFSDLELRLRRTIAQDSLSPEHLFLTLGLPPVSVIKKITQPIETRVGRPGPPVALLEGPGATREKILALAKKHLQRDRPVLVLVPTHEYALAWQRDALGEGITNVVLASSGQSAATDLAVWQTVIEGSPRLVIGTRAAVWLPFRALGLIVIDQPNHHQFREEQAPYYVTEKIARARHAALGGHFVARTSLPALDIFLPATREHWRFIQPAGLPQLEVLPRAGGWLSQRSSQAVADALRHKHRVVFILNQPGWASGLVCQECTSLVRCQTCATLLSLTEENAATYCRYCQTNQLVDRCPTCGSSQLVSFGWGSERWKAELTNHYPTAVIADVPAADGQNWDIGLFRPGWLEVPPLQAELVVVIEPERLLFGNDYAAQERWLRFMLDVRSLAARTILIETRLKDVATLLELHRPLPKRALVAELTNRKAGGYPPYGRVVRISTNLANRQRLEDLRTSLRKHSAADAISEPRQTAAQTIEIRLRLADHAPLAELRGRLEQFDGILTSELID